MIVLLDLSAVFDTVNHDLSLSIFKKKFGITDTALNWYDTYLQPRQMKVCVNNSYSEELNLKYGVPEGSCSRANYFVAYFSPIKEIINKSIQINGYTDNHSLHHKFNTNSSHEEIDTVVDLQLSVKNIANWMTSMRLKLNCDKTELILFRSRQQLFKCKTKEIELDGNLIQLSDQVKYLGGGLDSTLKKHVSTVTLGNGQHFLYKRYQTILK